MKALRWYENYLFPVTNLRESVEISENLCENFADLLRMYISAVLLRPPPSGLPLKGICGDDASVSVFLA